MEQMNRRRRKTATGRRFALCAVFLLAVVFGATLGTETVRTPLQAASQIAVFALLCILVGAVVAHQR